MVATIIAQRYAKALLESAVADGAEERVSGEASALAEALGNFDGDVRRFLTEPLSSADDKLGVLLSAFPEQPHPLFRSFLHTVMENRRERFLPLMLKEFMRLMRENRGELKASLSTAFKLSPSQRGLIERELSARTGRKVELIPLVDRQILGGAKLKIEDTVYDGSLKGQLSRLEDAMRKEPVRRAPKPLPKKKAVKKKAVAKKVSKKKKGK
jgi:F-type H+-transporting ATPase subunit delta